jgi:hypothetical protein
VVGIDSVLTLTDSEGSVHGSKLHPILELKKRP